MAEYTFTMHMTLDWTVEADDRYDAVWKWYEVPVEEMLTSDEDGIITNLQFDEEVPNDLVRDDGREFLNDEDSGDDDRPVGGMRAFTDMVLNRLRRDGELSYNELQVSTGLSHDWLKNVLDKLVAKGLVAPRTDARGRRGVGGTEESPENALGCTYIAVARARDKPPRGIQERREALAETEGGTDEKVSGGEERNRHDCPVPDLRGGLGHRQGGHHFQPR
jgi:hypothetical protein